MAVRHTVSSMMFCKKGCSNGIRAWSSATAVPSRKWLSSYLKATERHYVMYQLRQDRMDVIEINLIFLKLGSDYELSQSEFMSSRIQFPPWCDMLLSVGNYSVAPNNESCHRDQKHRVFDGDHLVTTGTVAHIYHRLREKKKKTWRFPDFTWRFSLWGNSNFRITCWSIWNQFNPIISH